MWPGTKARLKGRANMIKACPYELVRPEEMDSEIHSPRSTPPWAPALHMATSTNQTVRGSGLSFGFNLRLKHESTVSPLAWGVGAVECVFSPASADWLFDFLFSSNFY